MLFVADMSLVAAFAKGLAAFGAACAGVALLWSAHVDRSPRLLAVREARRKPYASPHSVPLPKQVEPSRMTAQVEVGRLSDVMDRGRDQAESVQDATLAARRRIDAAEVALNRLVQDLAAVMPTVIAPTVVPRRSVAVSVAPHADVTARAA